MTFQPLPHQYEGAKFLADRRYALLADEPGAGKTAQVAMGIAQSGVQKVLIVSPVSVKGHWAREIKLVAGRQDVTVVGGIPKAIGPGITVVGHSALAKEDTVQLLNAARFDLVVTDESHCFSNPVSARSVYLLGATPKSLYHHCDRMWLLTGSPIVNSAADLYQACASIFSNGAFIPYQEFVKRYTDLIPDPWAGERSTGLKNEAELKAWLRPHMLRRADFLNLPPRTITARPLPIADKDILPVLAALNQVRPAQLTAYLERGLDPDEAMSRVRRALGVAKVEAAADAIGELLCCGYGPVVAFYHHRDVKDGLFSLLKSYRFRVAWIDGAVTNRQPVIDSFQRGELDVLLLQTQAAGTGITATRSCRGVVVEQPWTAVALEQAVARLHRITQTRPVTVEILTSTCWLDDVMSRILIRKATAAKLLLTDEVKV